jgi:HTH-type transcriptional regulator / antitoxin HipB
MKTTDHDELLDEIVGRQGTIERENFESELRAEILAYKFKELRKQKKLTQSQLAEKLGMGKGQISKIESGKFNLTLATINKIASELDVRVNFSFQKIELMPVS